MPLYPVPWPFGWLTLLARLVDALWPWFVALCALVVLYICVLVWGER